MCFLAHQTKIGIHARCGPQYYLHYSITLLINNCECKYQTEHDKLDNCSGKTVDNLTINEKGTICVGIIPIKTKHKINYHDNIAHDLIIHVLFVMQQYITSNYNYWYNLETYISTKKIKPQYQQTPLNIKYILTY